MATGGQFDVSPDILERHNGRSNLYFGLNEVRPDFSGDKPKKADIAVIHGVGVDLDPSDQRNRETLLDEARALLDDDLTGPDVVIDSGNGVQAIWWVDPLEATPANNADAEAQGRGLAHRFNGDAVQNVDRVLRLPGTVNIPTATKRAKGRKAAPAVLIGTGDRLIGRGLDSMRIVAAPVARREEAAGAQAYAGALVWPPEDPSPDLQARWAKICAADAGAGALWGGDAAGLKDESRSGRDFAMAGHMRRHGLAAHEGASLLWSWEQGGRGAEMDERYFRRAWGRNSAVAAVEEFDPVDLGAEQRRSPNERPSFDDARPFDLSAVSVNLPKRAFIYGVHLARRYVSVSVAAGGTGKSMLLTASALAMAVGRPLLGDAVHDGPKRVWMFNLEDPLDEMHRRVVAAMKHFGLSQNDIGDRLFLTSGRDTPLCIARQGRDGVVIDEATVEALIAAILKHGVDVVMIDPIISSHRVSENDNAAIDAVAKTWARIADRTNAAVELSHHMRKLGGMEATADSGRGASALVDAARSVRVLQRMSAEEGAKLGVPEDERRRYVRVASGKENLALSPTAAEWLRLESVQLANGDNVGVATRWVPSDVADQIDDADVRTIQAAVAGRAFAANAQAHDWVGLAMAAALELDPNDDAVRVRMKILQRDLLKRGYFVERQGENRHRRPRPVIDIGIRTEEANE